MKRILTIQDISCVGKCSLTVALPIISAFGVETSVLPTAVLSTHTMFKGFTFRDLTCDIEDIEKHWLDQKIDFDSIYTGYLGSFEQLELCSKIFKDFKKKDNFILVDPVMADNGKLYPGFDQNFADNMAVLCGKADIIVPNLTEASFMLHTPYIAEGYDEDYIKDLLVKLTDLGCNKAILTGVSFEKDKLGVYTYDKNTKEYFSYFRERLPVSFHGTGDIFSSALCGALAIDKGIEESLKIAVDYTVESIKVTMDNPEHNWYGVEFEKTFPYLIDRIK
ncbi:MAG: pyridoxamine kinase [Clostridiales bacterium]|nr:pyridoxamine kinase [Clostridiales bacterium]